jgi:hypothetical protein
MAKWSHLLEVSRRGAMKMSVPLYRELLRNGKHLKIAMRAIRKGSPLPPRSVTTVANLIFKRRSDLPNLGIKTVKDASSVAENLMMSLAADPRKHMNASLRQFVSDLYSMGAR